MVKKIEISHHAKYTCSFCGMTRMKRTALSTWHCGSCMKTVAGDVWMYNTTSAVTVKSAIRRLKELKDEQKHTLVPFCLSSVMVSIYVFYTLKVIVKKKRPSGYLQETSSGYHHKSVARRERAFSFVGLHLWNARKVYMPSFFLSGTSLFSRHLVF
uniref:Ribosomal protein L37a n=1 Tax=Varanus komodoensis TaxID=61221 RepID=A0A8D2J9M6_VARKO